MARQKKDAKRFCSYIRTDILELLSAYSEKTAIPKTAVIEKALEQYLKQNYINMDSPNEN